MLAALTLGGMIQLWMVFALALTTGLFAVADDPPATCSSPSGRATSASPTPSA